MEITLHPNSKQSRPHGLYYLCRFSAQLWIANKKSKKDFIQETVNQAQHCCQKSRFVNPLISNLKMYVCITFVILFVFYMYSARAGLLSEKMKLSTTQHDSCPPGSGVVQLESDQRLEKHHGIPLMLYCSSLRWLLT